MLLKLSILVLPLLFTACGNSTKKSKSKFPKVEVSECFSSVIKDRGATCKYLTLKTVPEDKKDDRTVKVYYSIINAKEQDSTLDPVVFLVGGPGYGANTELDESFDDMTIDSIIKKHKLIIVDYRGTGFSEPYVDCKLNLNRIETDFNISDFNSSDFNTSTFKNPVVNIIESTEEDFNASLAVCTQKMKEIDIKATDYTTKKIARDIDSILEIETIDQAILYGISYGTRVALTMARDYPQRVSAMVLDGVFPIEANGVSQASEAIFEKYSYLAKRLKSKFPDDNLNDILNALKYQELTNLQKVANNTLKSIYKDAPDELSAALDYIKNLNQEKLYKHLITELLPTTVYLEGSVDFVHSFSSFREEQVKERLRNNKITKSQRNKISKSIDSKYESRKEVGTVMAYSIILAEELNFIDEQKQNLFGFSGNMVDAVDTFHGGSPLAQPRLSIVSKYFKVGETDPIEKEPVTTDIPTLLFSAGKDMQTTKSWALNTQKYLENSKHLFFPSQDHGFTLVHADASAKRDVFMENYNISGSSYVQVDE